MGIAFYSANSTPPDPFENFTGDDFTGTNGEPLNINYWFDQELGSSWLIQNNKATVNHSGATESMSDSVFTLSGDYDIQIDFETDSLPPDAIVRFITLSEDREFYEIIGVQDQGGGIVFQIIYKTNNVWDFGISNVVRTNTYGKLRIIRSGSNISVHYQDGVSGWSEAYSKTQDTAARLIRFHAKTYNPGDSLVATFDNFLINSGTLITP